MKPFWKKEKPIKVRILPSVHHPEMTLDEAWERFKAERWLGFGVYVSKLRHKGWRIT